MNFLVTELKDLQDNDVSICIYMQKYYEEMEIKNNIQYIIL